MLCRASEGALMSVMSSELSVDSKWCCWAVRGILGGCDGLTVGAGGGWGGGDGFWNVVGRLGLGAHQFGESKGLGLDLGDPCVEARASARCSTQGFPR